MDCFASLAMTGTLPVERQRCCEDRHDPSRHLLIRCARRRRARGRAAACQGAGDAGAGGDAGAVRAAKVLLHVHPVFGFIAAFAEAATIGGLADWYAVVALFKRPLGLPIPHTAIIQSNQHRIADKLGEFIEVHFLEAGTGRGQAARDRFRLLHRRLAARPQAQRRSRPLRVAPVARGVSATETSGLMTFITRRITTQLQSIDLAPLAAGTLRALRAGGAASGPARRHPARGASDADPGRDHGGDPRQRSAPKCRRC